MIARLEHRDGGTDLIDNADAFVAQNPAWLTDWEVAFEDVQIGAANRRFRYLHDRIGRSGDFGLWPVFQGFLAHRLIDKRLHRRLFCLGGLVARSRSWNRRKRHGSITFRVSC